MAERYTALGYVQLLHENFVRSGNYPKKYCCLKMAQEINLDHEKFDANAFIGMNMIRNVAIGKKMKPLEYMHKQANAYLFDVISKDLIQSLRELGLETYKAVRQDIKDKNNNNPWAGCNTNDVRELAEFEVYLTDDLCDELPFDK